MTATSQTEEFLEAQIGVVAARLIVGGVLWSVALALIDRTGASATDPYVANTRWALWLFLIEILVGTYYVRYTADASYPLFKRAAFVVAETCTQAWRMAVYVVVHLTIRWVIVTLFTALAIFLVGTGPLTRIVALLPVAAFLIDGLYGLTGVAIPPIIRGTHLGSYNEAIQRAATIVLAARLALVQRLEDKGFDPSELLDVQVLTYPFGGVIHPYSTLDPHYLFLGTTRSGKTLCIRMLLYASLRPFGELKHRALIYDGKREYYPLLIGMGIPASKVLIMNPADSRCVAWDLASDIHNRDDAANLTAILIPDDKDAKDNQFFTLALRSIVVEVIMSLHFLSPGKWRLIDVLNALRTPRTLKRVLKTTDEGREVLTRYFTKADETVGGIVSTIDARFISQYETIARIWARCERSISLTAWVQDRSVLLLGYDANRASVDRINQAIFQRVSQLICSLPEDSEGRREQTWVVLDEVRFTGKLPMLPELISFGRTKNAHVVLAPQDIDGLIDVYGEHRANEMLSLCGNVAILRLLSPKTREWAAKFFGEYESWETDKNHSVSRGGGSSSQGGSSNWSETWGTSTRRVKRESVLPSEFFNLPVTDRQNGMHGFFATPSMGAWRAEIPPAFIDAYLPPADPEAIPFIARSDFAVDPVRWSEEEEQRYTRRPEPTPPSPDEHFDDNPTQPNTTPPRDKKRDASRGQSSNAAADDQQKNGPEEKGAGSDPLPNW